MLHRGTTLKNLDTFTSDSHVNWQGDLHRGAVILPNGSPAARVSGRITTTGLDGDWSGFDSLQFTVHNSDAAPVIGGIFILDEFALTSPERDYGDFVERGNSFLFPEGLTHVVIDINPIQTTQGSRMLDLKKVRDVSLLFPNSDSLAVTNLRLAKVKRQPDEAAGIKPGDTVMHMHHMDLETYVYAPEQCEEDPEVKQLRLKLEKETARLENLIEIADLSGKQTFYEKAPLVISDLALKARPILPWHFSTRQRKSNLSDALLVIGPVCDNLEHYLKGIIHEEDEDDSNIPIPTVKHLPSLRTLKIKGRNFVDEFGEPVLVCAMNYHHSGRLMDFFAPDNHRMELFAVGGGSRYDIETSPVYHAFHASEKAKRVGWRGWCGHLIKDQWAMGGRKENVVICLEHKPILKAIQEYNRLHINEWRSLPNLMYTILAYELMYTCFCDESIRRFRKWLQVRHKTIKNLNACWGTRFKTFAEATPPPAPERGPAADANRAAWFDWADWNTRRFTDHLKWTRKDIKSIDPKVPTCAGGTHSMFSPSNGVTGIDEEMIINEVNDVSLVEGDNLLAIDLFHAMAEKPKPVIDPEYGGSCYGWLPNFLHGKSTISKFWWPKQPSRCYPHMTLMSPQHGTIPLTEVAEQLRIALDVRRLSGEICAFWDLPTEVAIHYSKTNMLQIPPALMTARTTPFLSTLRMSYDAARFLDAKPTFVSERMIVKGADSSIKILILPAIRHLRPEVFKGIQKFLQKGGNVVVLPEMPEADQYNRPAKYLSEWGIRIEQSFVPKVESLGEFEQGYDQNLDRSVVFGAGKEVSVPSGDPEFFGDRKFDIKTSGVFQQLQVEKGRILAQDKQLGPVLVEKKIGQGRLYIFAGMPNTASLSAFLDCLYEKTGVERHLRVADTQGNRINGLEARLIRRRLEDLVYVVNTTDREIRFTMKTDRPFIKIRELRSLAYWPKPEGVIPARQTLLFAFYEDQVKKAQQQKKKD